MWTTSAAVCAEGFCKKELQLSAQLRVCKKGTVAKCAARLEGKDLQLSEQIKIVVL